MKAKEAIRQLEERIDQNRRRGYIGEARDQELFEEYVSTRSSYRKMAKKHKLGVNTIMRAIRRHAESLP